MHTSQSKIGTLSAAMLGIGSMVGAGIFALLGEAASIAGSAVWISFLIGGVIALLSGYSLARLGARYPSAGGIIEYLVQGWGTGLVSGALSLLLYFSGVVGMSLVARAFGSYGAEFLPMAWRPFGTPVLATLVVLVLMLVNLEGAKNVSRLENLFVIVKFLVLIAFGIGGLTLARGQLLEPATWPPAGNILSTVGLTFFAFSGYSVITNTAEDMSDPKRMLPRATIIAIVMVLVLYLLVSFAVLGSLSAAEIKDAKDYALAEAARPLLGAIGFMVMTVTALLSTASSLNANLYSVTNISYQMAKDGELPQAFGKEIAHSREGLVISSALVAILATTLDLSSIAAVGAVLVLVIQSVVHAGHWRLRHETGASKLLIIAALLGTTSAAGLALYHQALHSPGTIILLTSVLFGALLIEFILQRRTRIVKPRVV